MARDPVFWAEERHGDEIEDGWYFWDCTWAFTYGPYTTEQEARRMLERYCREELG